MAETLRFDVLGKGDASDLERLANAVDRITDELKKLDRQRANPTVDVDTKKAERQVGQFAENMQRRIRRAIESLPDIELDADASDADREIAEIRRELAALDGKRIGVDVDTETARRQVVELERRLKALDNSDVDVAVRADVAAALAELRRASGEVDKLDGRTATVKVKVDTRGTRGLRGLLQSLTGKNGFAAFAASVTAVGAAATAAVAGVGGLAAATGSLGAAVVATGPILLAGAGMIGGVFATLKVGAQGLSQAFEALAEGDMKAWGEALANLSPEAQKFAVAIKDVWGALRQAKGAVQDRLFEGMGEAVSKLARTELPVLKTGMGAVATEINKTAKSVMEYIGSAEGISRQESMWRSTATVVRNLSPAFKNVTAAMFDIGEVGGRVLADITGGTGEAGAGFRKMVADARESGQLEAIMRRGVEVLRQIGSIAGNVGSILGSVFKAAQTAGSDFLSTLERGTKALADFLKTGAGQTALVDFFREARATLDALGVGLKAAAQAAAAFISAFSQSGGLSALGTALSAVMVAVAPLAATLGQLAGETLRMLAEAATAAAAALTPIVAAISAVVSALGPLAPMIVASVLAFKALSGVGAAVAGLAASFATVTKAASGTTVELGRVGQAATKLGASETAVARLSRAFSVLGAAIPVVAVALVGLIALYEQAASKADQSAQQIIAGSMSMRQAVEQEVGAIENRNAAYRAANIEGQEFASVTQNAGAATRGLQTEQQRLAESTDRVRDALRAAYDQLSPFEKLQADVTMAQRELNDALAENRMDDAAAAAEKLSAAEARLQAAEDAAAQATKTHAEAVNELTGAMQSQVGSALAYEEAVKRTAEAHKEANEALKQHGAESEQFKSSVLDLAQAQEHQAQAAQRAVEAQLQGVDANTRADAALRAYSTELLKVNDGTEAGRAAFMKLASSMDQAGLDALSAAAKMSGLRTEVLTLPDGRTVTVVTEADTAQLDSVKGTLEEVERRKYIGTVTIVGDPAPFRDGVIQNVEFANGQRGVVTIDGNDAPIRAKIGANKYTIDATTGVMTIDGDPAPGEADLTGLKLKVDSTTGTITIEGDAAPVDAAKSAAEQPSESTHHISADAAAANAARSDLEAPSTSTHTFNVDASAVTNAKVAATTDTSSTHTINADATAVVNAKVAATTDTSSTHTINVNAQPVIDAKLNATQDTQSLHTINCDDKAVVDAKTRAEQATQSLHTINCDDSAVVDAKRRAQQSTSSTHTIHVRVVGAAVPRAAGAYATPMAAGGFRRMSAARAEIVPPRQPRLIGDRMRGDEAFIPVNNSKRSQQILQTTANRMGFDLVPHGAGEVSGALAAMRSAVSTRPVGVTGLNDQRIVAAIEQLRRDLGDTPRQINTEINVRGAGAEQTADAIARSQRRQVALGLWG